MSEKHEVYLQRCIELSRQAVAHGNHPFGALLVRNGEIVMEAENTVESEVDITGHAELNLVRRAVHELGEDVVRECTLYTSTEPCAMCSGAIYWSGISRVVYACSAKRLGEIAGGSLLFPCQEVFAHGVRKVEVSGPILEDAAAEVHTGFW
jgi:tRNA(Arg) A34 adenosine deaminase TadA